MPEKFDINLAYKTAEKSAKEHYENFPVISFFLPAGLRKHVAVIYVFSRTADDIADEGKFSPEERISNLDSYKSRLVNALDGNYEDEFWFALHQTIIDKKLDPELFYLLLDAFRQDISKNRYTNFREVLDYCKRSANPVGRLVLQLHGITDERAYYYSDYICTALQITNFLQDISVDLEKDRIYLPEEDLTRFSVNETSFRSDKYNKEMAGLIDYQVRRVSYLFSKGRKLLPFLPGMLKVQIMWTILGGEKILMKVGKLKDKVIKKRPHVSKPEYLQLMLQALFTSGRNEE